MVVAAWIAVLRRIQRLQGGSVGMMPYRLVMSAMSRGIEWQQVSPAIPGRPGRRISAPLSTWWPLAELQKKQQDVRAVVCQLRMGVGTDINQEIL